MSAEGINLVLDLRYVRRLLELSDDGRDEQPFPGFEQELFAARRVLDRLIRQEEEKGTNHANHS